MRTKHLCALITSEIRVGLVPSNMFKPSCKFLAGHFKAVLLLWIPFCHMCFVFVFIILSCLSLAVLWPTAGNGLTSCV